MEGAGLVGREPDPDDGRGVVVRMTGQGLREWRRARPIHHAWISERFGRHLTDAEARTLGQVARKLLAALGREPSPLGPPRAR